MFQLHSNSTFTAKDIHSGLLHYTLLNPTSVVSNISDMFTLSASDLFQKWPIERQGRRGHFPVQIPTAVGIERLDLKITSPRPVSWLSQLNRYGAILGQNEIDITNSTVTQAKLASKCD